VRSLEVRELSKSYAVRADRGVAAVNNVSLAVEAGEFMVLLGPSGSGKTTLLRCVAGLLEVSGGQILLGDKVVADAARGTHVPPYKRGVGMVFQNFALWPHMNVEQNVAYPLKAQHKREELRAGRVQEMLALVHCSDLATRLPATLSGGQQQRVALARALVARPALILFDEPLSNLDALLRAELRAQLREIHRSTGVTSVYVPHDQTAALSLATRIGIMNNGSLVQVGTPEELYGAPASEFAADFMGMVNRLVFRAHGDRWLGEAGDVIHRDLEFLPAPGSHVAVAVRCRPQAVRLYRRDASAELPPRGLALDGEVIDRAFYGEQIEYVVRVGGAMLKTREGRTPEYLAIGNAIVAWIDRAGAAVFPIDA
jgi:iron(III) transport system ATP-binding protein